MARVDIPYDSLVLACDGRKALFLRNRGTRMDVNLATERVLEQKNPATREQGTDRPGRFPGTDGKSRSAAEETDWHQQAEDRFASRVADVLYRMAHGGELGKLIVVAPARTLGVLRKACHKEVADRVIAELDRDLTSMPVPEIARLLS